MYACCHHSYICLSPLSIGLLLSHTWCVLRPAAVTNRPATVTYLVCIKACYCNQQACYRHMCTCCISLNFFSACSVLPEFLSGCHFTAARRYARFKSSWLTLGSTPKTASRARRIQKKAGSNETGRRKREGEGLIGHLFSTQ